MKLKKITTFSLALALCLSSLAVGCGKKLSPKEKLIAVTEASSNIKSIEATYSMNLNTPESEFAKFSGTMAFPDFMSEGKMTQNISFNGMGVDQTIIMKDGKTYTSIPMLNKFLASEETTAFNMNNPEMKELQKQMIEKFKTVLDEVEVTETKEDKLFKLNFALTDEQTAKYINETVDSVFTEDVMNDIKADMETELRTQIQASAPELSEEEIAAAVEQQTQMSLDLVKSMLNESTFTGFSANYYVDDKNVLKKADMSISVDLADSIKSMFSALGLEIPVLTIDMTVDYKSINEKVTVDYSELTEENTITMEEYAQQLSGLVETPDAA